MSTLYAYVDGHGRPKEAARKLLEEKQVRRTASAARVKVSAQSGTGA